MLSLIKALTDIANKFNRKIEIEEVWDNPNPNGGMGKVTTVKVNLKNVTKILVRYRVTYWTGTSDAYAYRYALLDVGIPCALENGAMSNAAHYYTHNKSREVMATNNSITFGLGYVSKTDQAPTLDSNSCLPQQVYIVRGML